MSLLKIFILSSLLFLSIYAAEKKDTQVIISYDNIHTSIFKSASQANALNIAYKNINCQNQKVTLIGTPVCSGFETNMKSKMWDCLVVYSCTE